VLFAKSGSYYERVLAAISDTECKGNDISVSSYHDTVRESKSSRVIDHFLFFLEIDRISNYIYIYKIRYPIDVPKLKLGILRFDSLWVSALNRARHTQFVLYLSIHRYKFYE